MPWPRKLRLHKACTSWAGAILASSSSNMKEAEEEIVYEVIYKDENCRTEVEKKTLSSPPPGMLDQAGGVKRRKRKLSKSSEQEVVLVVHGDDEKFESAQDSDQALDVDPLLKTCSTNDRLLDRPDIEKKMKMIQSDADAPEKETIPSPPEG